MEIQTIRRLGRTIPVFASLACLLLLPPAGRSDDHDREHEQKPARKQKGENRNGPERQNRDRNQQGQPSGTGTRPNYGGPSGNNQPGGERNFRTQPGRDAAGRPMPRDARVVETRRGGSVVMRNNGRPAEVRTPGGIDVRHNLAGGTTVIHDRPGGTRVVVEGRGAGYVQHPYVYRGHDYVARTYYVNGRAYQSFYHSYPYRSVYLDVYAPRRYYPVGFYAYVGTPWVRPVYYSWGFAAAPWYGFYGFYFRPYPVYYGPDLWLTDYLISESLAAAYQAQVNAQIDAQIAYNPPPSYAQPALTPEVKQAISDEVRRQMALENSEAQANLQYRDPDPSASSIEAMLSDNQPHVFVAGDPLDVVNAAGNECPISEGDVLQLAGPPPPGASSAALVVMASKGGIECRQGSSVYVAFQDLQDMQNHMRQTLDRGLADLQSHQGGLPMPPPQTLAQAVPASYATSAPPPDPDAATQINQQYQEAGQAERDTLSDAGAPPPPASAISPGAPTVGAPSGAAPGAPPTITLGQTTDQVVAAFGQPAQVVDLGSKKIYVYPNLKVTFTDGTVSDVQ